MSEPVQERFILDDPCELYKPYFVPTPSMTTDEKYNSMIRLSIIGSVALFAAGYKHWVYVLLFCLFIIILLRYLARKGNQEGFAVTPTYSSNDFQQTVVTPTYAEEWDIPPPVYDLYDSLPPDVPDFEEPLQPQSYPYGQYLTSTNLLPSDEYYTRINGGGLRQAREYANSSYLRNDIAFRENLMRIYKKKIDRRFRHDATQDSFSPYQSF